MTTKTPTTNKAAAPKTAAPVKFKQHYAETLNTKPGILMFPNIAYAKPFKENDSKKHFGASVICKPSDRTEKIIAAINDIGFKSFGQDWYDNPRLYNKPFLTGEEVIAKSDKVAQNETLVKLYTGKIVFRAKSKEDKEPPAAYLSGNERMPRRPGNVDDLKSIEHQFYAGAIGLISLTPFSYQDSKNSMGVSAILKAIKFVQDGPRLTGVDLDALMAADDFSDEDIDFEDVVSNDAKAESVEDANV